MRNPLWQIANNAGIDGDLVFEKVSEGKAGFGFNAATGKYEDLIKAGIIDPALVSTYLAWQRRKCRGPDADHQRDHHRARRMTTSRSTARSADPMIRCTPAPVVDATGAGCFLK